MFYDGANEINVYALIEGGTDEPSTSYATRVRDLLAAEGAFPAPERPIERSPEARIAGAESVYARGVQLGRWIARGAGVGIVHFFQPALATKSPETTADDRAWPPDPEGPNGHGRDRERWRWETMRSSLPSTVIDLGDALDGVVRPVYFDPVHTNELGARMVARAMYEELRPRLERLAQRSAASP